MKKFVLYLLFPFYFSGNAFAQIENHSVDGNWKSVVMHLVRDEFRPFYMYYPESDADALKIKIKNGEIYFSKEVHGLMPDQAYSIGLIDERSPFRAWPEIEVIKSDNYHIVISIPDLEHPYWIGFHSSPRYQLAFERDY